MSHLAYFQSGNIGRYLDGFAKFLSERGIVRTVLNIDCESRARSAGGSIDVASTSGMSMSRRLLNFCGPVGGIAAAI